MELTGLQKWSATAGCAPEEIIALAMTESHENWKDIFGPALDTASAIPAGRAVAIEGLLHRGRDGEIFVPLSAVVAAMDTTEDTLRSVLDANPDLAKMVSASDDPSVGAVIRSDGLTDCLVLLRRSLGRPEPAMEPVEKKTQTASAAKTPARKRTKYTLSKAAVADLLGGGNQLPTRAVRLFLLSLPDFKAQDVALMSDAEVSAVFAKDYAVLSIGGGAVVLPKENCEAILVALGQGNAYYLPAADINPEV